MKKKSATEKTSITLDGTEIALTPEHIDIHKAKLDSDNPRIRYLVGSNGLTNPTQDELKNLLFQVNGVQELLRKIRDNRGTIDPIIISADDIVIEGNCRLACYRHLCNGKDSPWKKIPAHRLPRITQRQIDILLSKYHVSGKINWRSYEQAGQIHRLKHRHGMAIAEITRVTGLGEKVVKDLLKTYDLMTTQILNKLPGSRGLKKFSYVYEFYKHPELEEWRSDEKSVREFGEWVVSGKLKKGEDVRELPKILKSPQALKTLRTDKDGGKKALALVVRPWQFEALEETLNLLGDLAPELLDRLKSDRKEQRVLKNLYSKIRDVAGMAEVELQ